MELREHWPAFCNRTLGTAVLNIGWYCRQGKWSQEKTSILSSWRRCGNVLAAEVTVTSRRKMRSCKGDELEWKQVLFSKCTKEVLQECPYKHSLVPNLLAFPFLLPWGWWLKCWVSRNKNLTKALSANDSLMLMICSIMQKSFNWDCNSEDNICVLLQEMIWDSVLMPRDWALYSQLRKELSFFFLSFFPL